MMSQIVPYYSHYLSFQTAGSRNFSLDALSLPDKSSDWSLGYHSHTLKASIVARSQSHRQLHYTGSSTIGYTVRGGANLPST